MWRLPVCALAALRSPAAARSHLAVHSIGLRGSEGQPQAAQEWLDGTAALQSQHFNIRGTATHGLWSPGPGADAAWWSGAVSWARWSPTCVLLLCVVAIPCLECFCVRRSRTGWLLAIVSAAAFVALVSEIVADAFMMRDLAPDLSLERCLLASAGFWLTFCGTWIFLLSRGWVSFFSVEKRAAIDGQNLPQLWASFFRACCDRGAVEVERGRISLEEVEAAEPRVMLALPSLVILQSLLGSDGKGVVLPGGNEITEGGRPAQAGGSPWRRSDPREFRVFERLAVAHRELQGLEPLTCEELYRLELRALQADMSELGEAPRDVEVNRVAASISAAAIEVSQLSVFTRMGKMLEEIQQRANGPQT